ncbi:MAG: sulfatase-like hydrolase/transferase [Bergeyella zoohelcum]|nr:sulfatase-like hydrolase/transferase [Bergeyella zoohelcum]
MKTYFGKIKPFIYLGGFYVLLSIILRGIFIFHPITTAEFSFVEIVKIFGIGFINDIFVFTLASAFLAVYFLFLSNGKYQKPYGQIILFGLVAFFIYTAFIPNNIFRQYGGSVWEIATAFVGIKTLCFALMFFLSKYRKNIRLVFYGFTIFLYTLLIIFNSVSEYFFYNEFGVRYNFIAVDYLIYTNEVIGNIIESYPVIPLFSAILLLTGLVSFFIIRYTKNELNELPNFKQKLVLLGSFIVLCGLSIFALSGLDKIKSQNVFTDEIQANGLPKFYWAFTHSELDYFQFYSTLPEKEAEKIFFSNASFDSLERQIVSDQAEIHKNVVLISVESLSAEFMKQFGNTQSVTPFLDDLAEKSLSFNNLYATGNRTVRGLEALTLCIPPTAGESIVKREDNKNKFTTGSVFKSKGYSVKYLYGGYSYFDNMKDFFGGNGYDIVDRDAFTPEEITFANVWGVCDEDMATKAVQVMNEQAKSGKPFFNHWMTVSNHRPFTYPNGKIDIPGDAKSREGGVKYTDYSIKRFFEMAKKQAWYKNTIFVIVADHCASSAGKTELPLDKYHIPALIFSEGFIKPEKNDVLMSQVDLMPTLLGLLNFSYTSKFLGEDVLKPTYKPRAYIATYQDLGLIKDNHLTIISPVRKTKQYELKPDTQRQIEGTTNIFYTETPVENINQTLVKDCISTYQTTSFWVKNKMINK